MISVQPLTAILATPAEMPHAGLGPINGQNQMLPVGWQFHYSQFLCDLVPMSVEVCYDQPVSLGIGGSPIPALS
jgi:hypothetical protein